MKRKLLYNIEFSKVEPQATQGSSTTLQNHLLRLLHLFFPIFQCSMMLEGVDPKLKVYLSSKGCFSGNNNKMLASLPVLAMILNLLWPSKCASGKSLTKKDSFFYFSFKFHPICRPRFKGTNWILQTVGSK